MRKRRLTAWTVIACAGLMPSPAAAERPDPARRLVEAINEIRASHGLRPYSFSERLAGSSERFAAWQMETDFFGHAEMIRASGRWRMLGEALAMHRGHRLRVGSTVRRWSRSPTHASLLLSRAFGQAGAGMERGRLGRARTTIWVLQLGRR